MTVHLVGYDAAGKLVYDTTATHVYVTGQDGLVTRMDIVEDD